MAIVAGLAERKPQLRALVGGSDSAQLFIDKLESFRFAQEAGLCCVPTSLASEGSIEAPAIAKPRFGSGSVGVRLLLNEAQVLAACGDEQVILQPLLGPVPEVPDVTGGWPLFWQCTPARQSGMQGLILPDGSVGPCFPFEVVHSAGKVERMWASDDPDLHELGIEFLAALAEAGWRGPANIACVHSGTQWLCLELNGRFTGGTAARTALGFDEVTMAINAWAGGAVVPTGGASRSGLALMQPSVAYVSDSGRDRFLSRGLWP